MKRILTLIISVAFAASMLTMPAALAAEPEKTSVPACTITDTGGLTEDIEKEEIPNEAGIEPCDDAVPGDSELA